MNFFKLKARKWEKETFDFQELYIRQNNLKPKQNIDTTFSPISDTNPVCANRNSLRRNTESFMESNTLGE